MSQRDSGYERKEHDFYETPSWVTEALLPHIPSGITIWEPAAGSRKMAYVLGRDNEVDCTDITDDPPVDFLTCGACHHQAIITNPPYNLAQSFIQKACGLMFPNNGIVAMLLRTDFDHAKTRLPLFNHRPFAKKVVLTRRIKWFEDSKGSPSFNHAWFIWDWKHIGPPTLAYGP